MSLEQVPLLSMRARRAAPDAFAHAIGESFQRFGFAMVSDHGLDRGLIERTYAAARTLFALPEDKKLAYCVPGGAGQRGYTPFGRENAKGAALVDLKEFWHVGRELAPDNRLRAEMPDNVWPTEVAGFRDSVYGLYQALDALGLEILGAIARHLKLGDEFFETPVRDGDSVLRLLHYPPVARAAAGVRAGAHEDINVITLLLGAEEAGLQLLDRDGRWLEVNPPECAIVINVGDMLQRLTNDVLPSTTHRVVNPKPERAQFSRYSIPFFLHFAPDYVIETLPSCITQENPNRYPTPISERAFLEERLREIGLM